MYWVIGFILGFAIGLGVIFVCVDIGSRIVKRRRRIREDKRLCDMVDDLMNKDKVKYRSLYEERKEREAIKKYIRRYEV